MELLAAPVGLFVGLCLGALGGGGSILTVPALVYLLGQSAHGATTTSLVIVGISALAGAVAHGRAGRVRVADGLTFGALGTLGSIAGSRLSSGLDANVLLGAFAALLLVGALAMLRRTRRPRTVLPSGTVAALSARPGAAGSRSPASLGATSPAPPRPRPTGAAAGRWAKVVLAATAVGLVTGFFGVGGGFVIVPALVIVLGLPMPQAVGTSLLVITIDSAVALASRAGTHPHVDWALTAIFIGGAVVGSLAGNRVAGRLKPERLSAGFSLLLVAVAIYMAGQSLPHAF